MKKTKSLLALLGVTMLVGCGQAVNTPMQQVEATTEVSTTEEKMEEAVEEKGEEKAEGSKESVEEQKAEEKQEEKTQEVSVDRTPMFELMSQISIGWNLGNTFDAHGNKSGIKDETYWGNPTTTKEMIDAVAAKGFNTIRIPVTWNDHVGAAPEYTINEEWMNRVQEVVDYCMDNDMYVILDTHHEPDYWLKPATNQYEAVSAELKAIWMQIATTFMDYDEHLIFEGMNEPRIKGSQKEWNGGTLEERRVIDKLNADFVETVRATGGNNATRGLIICPYGNCGEAAALRELKIPNDPMIAVAVHLYTPYDFTYAASSNSISVWDGSRKKDIVSVLRGINDYLLKDGNGVPVIVTEFGAENKKNEEEVCKWLEDYMGLMNEKNIPCVWWDSGILSGNGEKFGIFDRKTCTWKYEAVTNKLIELTR